ERLTDDLIVCRSQFDEALDHSPEVGLIVESGEPGRRLGRRDRKEDRLQIEAQAFGLTRNRQGGRLDHTLPCFFGIRIESLEFCGRNLFDEILQGPGVAEWSYGQALDAICETRDLFLDPGFGRAGPGALGDAREFGGEILMQFDAYGNLTLRDIGLTDC